MSKVTTKFGITVPTWGDPADESTKANSYANTAELAWDALEAVIPGLGIAGTFTALQTFQAASGSAALSIKVTGESSTRIQINGGGSLNWGDGTAAHDTTLARAGANRLTTATGDTMESEQFRVTGDLGGIAGSATSLSNATQGVSSGTGTVKMNSANPGNSTGWMKVYFGTTAKYIPVWDNPAP